jgi:perosamine synthetase
VAVNPSTQSTIPYAQPKFWGLEEQYMVDALRSGWISTGEYIQRLEKQFLELLETDGDSHTAITVSNGGAAIHCILLALDLRPGDEIIVPAFCYQAASLVAIQLGLTPVFADVDSETYCVTAESIKKVISPRTKAVVAVHSYGGMCDVAEIEKMLGNSDITLIEDAAEALGSKLSGMHAGTIAEIGFFSFHAVKTITTGEGGIIVCRNPEISEKLRALRTYGSVKTKYWHDLPGHNLRLSNLLAAIGCAQIQFWDEIVIAKKEIADWYGEELSALGSVSQQQTLDQVDPLIWAVAIEIDEKCYPAGRDWLLEAMRNDGIECRNGFYSPNQMPMFNTYRSSTPVSDRLAKNVLSLPTYIGIEKEQVKRVCKTILKLAQSS